ncbi:MAG TPA: RnfABCDGE type electron transport complex subunit B [Steroidobacteraceae bacterium]|jgi:electron transport complex protein RnfB|nr:RnfABCDGE type electron transport complex subunit B [Steroidobacteraceae bacterium]
MPKVAEIDALLPQTQCTRCGYPACLAYAQAVADGTAVLNQCPPGGAATIGALAALLQQAALPLNPANGVEGPALVALIDEEACIGCAKCLPPCPVDAIVGAQKQMHTVVLSLCTGCELCVAPCPVDCITMVARASLADPPPAPTANDNRERFAAHNARLSARARQRAVLLTARKQAAGAAAAWPDEDSERAR